MVASMSGRSVGPLTWESPSTGATLRAPGPGRHLRRFSRFPRRGLPYIRRQSSACSKAAAAR